MLLLIRYFLYSGCTVCAICFHMYVKTLVFDNSLGLRSSNSYELRTSTCSYIVQMCSSFQPKCVGNELKQNILTKSKALLLTTFTASATSMTTRASVAESSSITTTPNNIRSTIVNGRVFAWDYFLREKQIRSSRQYALSLEAQGRFVTSGLSNTASNSQNFGRKDRMVCPIDASDYPAMSTILNKLKNLRHHLAGVLDRPTLCDDSLPHELYFSVSGPGTGLARHLDEKHEELKSLTGWTHASRRSISWLLYLNDPHWSTDINGNYFI